MVSGHTLGHFMSSELQGPCPVTCVTLVGMQRGCAQSCQTSLTQLTRQTRMVL